MEPFGCLWVQTSVRLLVLWFEDPDRLKLSIHASACKVRPGGSLGDHLRVVTLANCISDGGRKPSGTRLVRAGNVVILRLHPRFVGLI
jgi:hypothetical protein